MLKLIGAFSKKQPVAGEQFSSEGYHCSVEVELSDAATPEQLQAKIHATFALVRDAVEAELHGANAAKSEPAAQPTKEAPQKADALAKASNRQIKFVTDLATAQGLGLSELNAGIQKRFGIGGLYDLSRREASLLLDELKLKERKKAA